MLDEPERVVAVAPGLLVCDPLRSEALLHAIRPNHARPRDGAPLRRWRAIRRAIRELERQGLTANRDDVELTATAVYEAVTGKTYADYLDEYADTLYDARSEA